jgi:hypothetical protein
MRMREVSKQLGFRKEAFHILLAQGSSKYLNGSRTLEIAVFSKIHRGLTTGSKQAHEAIIPCVFSYMMRHHHPHTSFRRYIQKH